MTIQLPRRSRAIAGTNLPEEDGLTFITVQLFSVIYLGKFAVGPGSSQISVPMIIMFVGMNWMIISQKITLRLTRLTLYMLFIGLCLLSQILSGTAGSLPSLLFLAISYSFLTVTVELSEAGYLRALDRFVKLMIVPAIIMIVQYCLQKATGQTDPINMNHLLPPSMLLQGYYYDAHYPWNSYFTRPNGFFFLEPSFASAFAASAAIIEITYFRRPLLIAVMLLGNFLSLGATGTTILIIASPFLLAREKPAIIGAVILAVVGSLAAAYLLGLPIPLLSRLGEFNDAGSSGSDRLLAPANEFVSLVTDPSFLFTGTGAGSASETSGSHWPIVKVLREYGLVAMITFIIFYVCGIVGNFNLPLKVALSVIYHFTGENLLSPIMVELVAIMCFMLVPLKTQKSRTTMLARHRSAAPASVDGRARGASRPGA